MGYFILQQDPRVPGQPSVLSCPEDIAPEEFFEGKHMKAPRKPLHLKMSERSGNFSSAIIAGILPLFHNKLLDELKKLGVDNLELFPVDLENPEGEIVKKYSLVNIVGMLDAVDQGKSELVPRAVGGRPDLKSFKIDAKKARGHHMFRIPEVPTLVIIDEKVKAGLAAIKPPGALIRATESYDGWG
jgi:hypothetical protein